MRIKIFILILICLLLCECKDRSIKTEDVKEQLDSMTMKLKDNESMEYMLASIDAGHYILRDDTSIEKFRTLLKQLDEKFAEDKKQIGDISVSAKFQLRDVAITESLLNIMKGMNKLFSGTPKDRKYAEYISLYLNMRKKGYSHNSTVIRSWILIHTGIYLSTSEYLIGAFINNNCHKETNIVIKISN